MHVAQVAKKLIDLGCFEISLGDTIGIGTTKSTLDMIRQVKVMHMNKISLGSHEILI